MNIDELQKIYKRRMYSRGEFSAASDDFLAYVYAIRDILGNFDNKEDALQWISAFGDEIPCYTPTGYGFGEKEILDAIKMREGVLEEIEKIKNLLSFWEDKQRAVP